MNALSHLSTGMVVGLGVFSLLVVGCALLLLRQMDREERLAARLQAARKGGSHIGATIDAGANKQAVRQLIIRMGEAIASSGVLPAKTLAELEATLNTAGFRGAHALGMFIGGKVLLVCLLPGLGYVVASQLGLSAISCAFAPVIAAIIGLLAPDAVVNYLRSQHLKAVEVGLADALDMMVICAEAGLALEPAVTRVGREIAPAHPAVSQEFLQTASELHIVADYRVALSQFAKRTGLEGVKRLTTTLIQTMQYGTPLTEALRVLSAEMRGEMLRRFEARAARLPVLLTIPMIVFILPCVFLVVGGPAMISVVHVFRG